MSEELIETTTETVLRREEAASRLRQLADQISRHNQIEFEREGMRYSVRIPDEVTLKLATLFGRWGGHPLAARVVWSGRKYGVHGFGVRFVDAQAVVRERLKKHLSR